MDHNTQYEPRVESRAPFCLGHSSHALRPGEVICSVCGALADHTTLGIYEVRKLLGIGRSGHAYQAVHQRSGQPVAIKLFPAYTASPELWEAARREVRVTTALRHNSILSVFSCGTWSSEQLDIGSGVHIERSSSSSTNLYLLTLCQYIPGALRHFVAYLQNSDNQQALYSHGSSPRALVMHILQQIGSALAAAHARGLAHGALVPGNILFSSYERAWVADFGLARLQPPPAPYLAPELYMAAQASQQGQDQAYWNAVSAASDQYMFAALSQQLLSQTLPGQEYEALLPVLSRAQHPKPERRYPSLQLLIHDMVTLTSQPSQMPVNQQFKQPQIAGTRRSSTPSEMSSSGFNRAGGRGSSAPLTPLPGLPSGPLTPALPATPITPATPLTPADWEKRGDKLFTMREYEEALKAYHRAIEVNAGKASVWLALGDTYFALERYKEALMAYEQAMHINPNDPQIWLNRGTVLDALGRHQEALDCYDRADQLRSA